jgi:hypothetical protein
MASGLILASKGFNRIVGHKHLPELVAALERKFASDKRGKNQSHEDAA